MAEKGKFAALRDLHRPLDADVPLMPKQPVPPPVTHPVLPEPEPAKGRGRPATGKRSNPEWKLYSHFLKRQTQRAAVARLQSLDDGRDLSDVLDELLETWLKS